MTHYLTISAWLEWFYPYLINHLWQTTIFALIIWVIVSIFGGSLSSRIRYLFWMIAFVKILIPSILLRWVIEYCGFNLPDLSADAGFRILFQISHPISSLGKDAEGVLIDDLSLISLPTTLTWYREFNFLLMIIWLSGFFLLFTRWVIRRYRFIHVLRACHETTEGPVAETFIQVKTWLSLKRKISLMESSQISGPGVWGIRRSIVIWPKGLTDQLSAEELEAVMLHELIHISRWDNLLAALQMTTCCLFWFHPLVWLIDRRLLAERESVCDEAVVRHIGKPRTYAVGLSKVAKFGLNQHLEGVLWATEINLKRRIEAMLDMKNKSKTTFFSRAITSTTACTLIILVLSMTVFTRDKVSGAKSTLKQKEISTASNANVKKDNIKKPIINHKEKAKYTKEAKDNKTEGIVILKVVLGADGKIGDIQVERGLPNGLTEEAIAAARLVQFEPGTKDGKPVSLTLKIQYVFEL